MCPHVSELLYRYTGYRKPSPIIINNQEHQRAQHAASLPTSWHSSTSHHNTPLQVIRPEHQSQPHFLYISTSVTVPSWNILQACPFPQPLPSNIHPLSLSPGSSLHWHSALCCPWCHCVATLKSLHKNHNPVTCHTSDDTFLCSATLDLWLLFLPILL